MVVQNPSQTVPANREPHDGCRLETLDWGNATGQCWQLITMYNSYNGLLGLFPHPFSTWGGDRKIVGTRNDGDIELLMDTQRCECHKAIRSERRR